MTLSIGPVVARPADLEGSDRAASVLPVDIKWAIAAHGSEPSWSVSGGKAAGNPPSMHVSDVGFPDAVPDAVVQQRPTADAPPDEDRESGVPLGTTASDWQEQREAALIDPEVEEPEQLE